MQVAQHIREQSHNGAGACIPTRSSLLSRIKDPNDRESWTRFYNTYWKVIYHTAIRAGLGNAEAEDVVQETLVAVLKNMPDFVYERAKGSFKTWLLKQTAWRIKGELRKRLPVEDLPDDPRADAGTSALDCVPDPAMSALEASWDQEWEKCLLEAALQRVKAKVQARQYQIFDCVCQKKWPVLTVARTLRISVARVYLAKHRVGNHLKKELLKLRINPAGF